MVKKLDSFKDVINSVRLPKCIAAVNDREYYDIVDVMSEVRKSHLQLSLAT